ncbi:MAG: NUDIX hydrolase [Candidatus Shapirobacteria bacterium]
MRVEVFTGLVVLDKNSRIYLIKENDKHQVGQGRWNLPGGGVDMGEGLAQNAVREALEETGYKVEPKSILGLYQGTKNSASWMFIVLEVRLKSEERKKVTDSDVQEGRWFTKKEFLGLDEKEIVHSDMKQVYQAALDDEGLPMDEAKVINFDQK